MASVWVGNRGTVRDYPGFSPSIDAEAIHKAIKGIGTDEHMLISILAERSSIQRRLIAEAYEAAYGEELKDDLKGDLSGHFKCLMVALVTPPAVFDAKQLKKSMKGTGTNEDALIEILTTRTSRQMREISQAYYTVYKKSLGDDISSETSGDFRKALLTLADGRRDESLKVDEHLAKKDAQVLYQAGENKWGTDEDKFTEILCLRSFPQLKLSMDSHYDPCHLTPALQTFRVFNAQYLENAVKMCKLCSNSSTRILGKEMGNTFSEECTVVCHIMMFQLTADHM